MYPEWKIILWRFVRVFLAAFIAQLALSLVVLETLTIETLWPTLVLPAVIAGISALGKAIRDKVGDDKYESRIHKLPL